MPEFESSFTRWIKEHTSSDFLEDPDFEETVRAWGDLACSCALEPHELRMIADVTYMTIDEVTQAYEADNSTQLKKAQAMTADGVLAEVDAHLNKIARLPGWGGY
jgi:hypothetical protein